jgi:hypothetical protein
LTLCLVVGCASSDDDPNGGPNGMDADGGELGTAGDPSTATPDASTAGEDAEVELPEFEDPGTAPWEPVGADEVAETCKLDPDLLAAANATINTDYAVVRYGKLCHEYYPTGSDASAEIWSSTKTLGALVTGIAMYQTRELERNGPKTGPISDFDRADHWLDPSTITFNPDATLAHVLAMVGHNADLSYGAKTYMYDTVGDVQINRLSDVINTAIAQDPERLGADLEQFTRRFLYDAIGMTDSTWSGGAADKVFAYTWSSTVRDMARVGLLILHRGVFGGQRVLEEGFIYKMIHPSFEDSNTAYGYLTWLNARSGAAGPGGAGMGVGGDPCSPAAIWNDYPHGLSEAPDCLYTAPATCEQEHDIGVWFAAGLGGQFIVGHAGLDLVLVVKNYPAGPAQLWSAVRPALVALDPEYAGDEEAFCEAYGSSSYAPDLETEIRAPEDDAP